MANTIYYEDFLGFSYAGIHSYDLGLFWVSDGDRYVKNLLPPLQDYTIEVPGGNGNYYFGSNFKPREFNLSIAFDSLTEVQIREIQRIFSSKIPQPLIFDDSPYKVYLAKCSASPSINFVCFLENGQRKYKGEGTINLISYYPFAKQQFKSLNYYSNYPNVSEWSGASKLKATPSGDVFTPFILSFDSICSIYNPGDISSDYILSIPILSGFPTEQIISVNLVKNQQILKSLDIDLNQSFTNSNYILRIDTKKKLLYLINNTDINNPIVTYVNSGIINGDFFLIDNSQVGDIDLIEIFTYTKSIGKASPRVLGTNETANAYLGIPTINYDYWFY